MRHTIAVTALLASICAASAADLDQAFPDELPRWDGAYGGLHVSGAWGETRWSDPPAFLPGTSLPESRPSDGIAVGGQLGYNRQIGDLVLGLEGRLSWTNLNSLVPCGAGEAGMAWVCKSDSDLLASLTGKAGYDLDGILVYIKGGLALKHASSEMAARNVFASVFQGEDTGIGWVAGLGVEYDLGGNWSVQAEYAYHDFGTASLALRDQIGSSLPIRLREYAQVASLGLNYRLWAPEGTAPAEPLSQPSPWQATFGARYWVSGGKFRFAFAPGEPVSTLTHSGTAHSGEAFGRLDYADRFFVKGYLGTGIIASGKLIDEDFPPITDPYSRTESKQKDGRLRYASIDAGLTLLDGDRMRLGAFAGYHFMKERMDTYGCEQLATSPICAPGGQPIADPAISQVTGWYSLRLGLVADWRPTDRLTLTVDAAYLPSSTFDGEDLHWLRPDVMVGPQSGTGNGVQVEAVLTYRTSDRFAVGVGGRYWSMDVPRGTIQDPGVLTPLTDLWGERYGMFLQASYDFGK